MNKILSFLIPAYNSQPYLKKCLDSFIVPEALDKIEVIVVNDGSTDETPAIAEEYVIRYPNTFQLLNKINGGHGSAINAGVRQISGTYIKVIDADDWIKTENLVAILDFLEKSEAQVVLAPYHTVDIQTGERKKYNIFCEKYQGYYSLKQILLRWRDFEHVLSFHGIIYESAFYRKYGISLAEGVFYEDHEYATIPFCRADCIAFTSLSFYEYLIGNSHQSMAMENQVKRLNHMEAVINHMVQYYKKQEQMTEVEQKFFLKKLESLILSYYKVSCLMNPNRKLGRRRCIVQNGKIFRLIPEIKNTLSKKYYIFGLISYLGMTYYQYESILSNHLYRRLKRKR